MTIYDGACHCGAVTFTFEGTLDGAIECNCTYCRRTGGMLVFGPREALTITAGEDRLTEYRFNHRVIRHLFCSTCGVESFGFGVGPDGREMAAVNVRALEGVDPWAVETVRYDGLSRA